MTVMICRSCGHKMTLRSRFEEECIECGSEELEAEDAYDPEEHKLRCEFCGYTADARTGPDADWEKDDSAPASIDDPCPICAGALVPASDKPAVRDQPEYKLAREAARKIHREHNLTGPPYELEELAVTLGLEIVYGRFDHDGMLVGERIEVPEGLSSPVGRFVIAHEIGHFVLRHQGERSKLEPEANAFSSELLVPTDELKAAITKSPSIKALRERFGISRQALVYALMGAGVINKVRP
jgi:IrrE N-terminal-like domain